MLPVRRLFEFWNWLPAFRVVAETEHLPTAATALGLTPQALSRSIKLLEDKLGAPLFRRRGRRLELNDDGRFLLSSLRAAMRGVDDAIGNLKDDAVAGTVRVAADSALSSLLVLPACVSVRASAPGLVPELVGDVDDVGDRLRRGALDIAVTTSGPTGSDLQTELLAELTYHVYCGQGHALFARRKVSWGTIAEHAFVAPVAAGADAWPPHLHRTVGVRVPTYQSAVELCATGAFLAHLAQASTRSVADLRGLRIGKPVSQSVYVSYRRPVGRHRRTAAMLAALRDVAGST